MLKEWLAHPLLRGMDLDDPRTTTMRRQIIQGNRFLRQIYLEWYTQLVAAVPPGDELVLELGSGPGFLPELLQDLIASEVFWCDQIHAVLDGRYLPLAAVSLRAILMTDVLHHIPNVRPFLRESARCVRAGGVIAMIEPWVTRWSLFVYAHFHHEPFEPLAPNWEFPTHGPLSSANGALPWIVFERDRVQFEREFPQWCIETIRPLLPFRYLVSGGVSMRPLMPGWSSGAWRAFEKLFQSWMDRWAMFALIVLRRSQRDAAS